MELTLFGGLLNANSVYMIPVSEALGISRASYALANIPFNVFSFLSTLSTAFLFRKFGYKQVAITSLILGGISLLMLSFCTTVWEYMFNRILFAVSYGACFTAGSVWIIKAWFHKHLGFLLGFTSMCTGLGGSLMTRLLSYIITYYSWRTAFLLSALLFVPITVLFLLIRNDPGELKLRPYGENQQLNNKKTVHTEWTGFSLKELLHRPSFYLMCINTFLCVVALYMTTPILVSYLCDSGYSKIDTSGFHAAMLASLSVAKLAGGWFSDKFGARPLAYIFLGCTAISQFMLLDVSDPSITYAASILLGIGASSATVMIPLLTLPLFGYQGNAQINSIMLAIPSLSNVISDTVANALYDKTGSYSSYFPILIVINILLLVSYTVLFALAKKDRFDYKALHGGKNTAQN